MKISNFHKILLGATVMVALGGINAYATVEQGNTQIDNVAPVFDQNVEKRVVLQRAEEETEFVPEELLTGITATDNVDGSNVKIEAVQNNVDLTRDGIYQSLYTATDKAGNVSVLCIEVIVDGIAPTFSENVESLYYISHDGIILDSNKNMVEKLPEMITATDALGAYAGIGIRITSDFKGNIVVFDTIENTPAYGKFLRNDVIIEIDDEDVRGKTPGYAASVIKGQEGTIAKIKVLRNNEEQVVEITREIIKLFGEEECIAEPDVDITSIDMKKDGVIEITYTATDQAGNTATVTVKVVIGETSEDAVENEEEDVETSEELEDVTTGGNPPEDLDLPEEIIEKETNVIEDNTVVEEENTVENITSDEVVQEEID